MSFDKEQFGNSSIESMVFYSAMKDKQIGVGIWDMKNDKFELLEQITDLPKGSFKSLPDFINKVALKKDQHVALGDLEEYLNYDQETFRTTFRIETKKGQKNGYF